MKSSVVRLIVTIAAIIVIFWLIGLALRLASWLLEVLLPVAAVILIAAIVVAWYRRSRPSSHTGNKKESLKISRDTSNKK